MMAWPAGASLYKTVDGITKIYHADMAANYTSGSQTLTGDVKFNRREGNTLLTITLPRNSSTATETSEAVPGGGSSNFIQLTIDSSTNAITHNGQSITGSQIATLLAQQDAGAELISTSSGTYKTVYKLKKVYDNGDVEFEGEAGNADITILIEAASNIGALTATLKPNGIYYIYNDTTVVNAMTNYTVTGNQIISAMNANGIPPIIYWYDNSTYLTVQYHYKWMHSGGMVFRTLDGAAEIYIQWGSSTVTKTTLSNGPFYIYTAWDSTNSKYVLKKNGSSLNNPDVTVDELWRNRHNLWLNTRFPVRKISSSDGWNGYQFIDENFNGSSITYTFWDIGAGAVSGVSVTRTTITK